MRYIAELKHAVPLLLAGLALIASITSALADFAMINGEWVGTAIEAKDGVEINEPDELMVAVIAAKNAANIRITVGKLKIDLDAAKTDDIAFYAAQESSMLGFFKKTAAPQLFSGDPVFWARETEKGVVFYHAVLADPGRLVVSNVALDREGDKLHLRFFAHEHGMPKRRLDAVLGPK